MRKPPSAGPKAPVIAVNPDQVPIALPRLSASNEALSSAKLPGISKAPPTPWRARAAMSIPTLMDRPQIIEAAVNTTTPITNTRRRP